MLGLSVLCGFVVALVSEQRNQVLSGALRISIRPETIFHKTGWRCLDCCLALDVEAQVTGRSVLAAGSLRRSACAMFSVANRAACGSEMKSAGRRTALHPSATKE